MYAFVLKVKNEKGEWVEIPALVGKSAYQTALDTGFEGTEAEWLASLRGEQGYSPEITVEQQSTGATIGLKDENGVVHAVTLRNGKDGTSPTVLPIADMEGRTGVSVGGVDIWSGLDGASATHEWNGTTLTVTSASGTSSANLKGKDGYTPVMGVDYWTPEEQAAIQADNEAFIADELAKRGQLKPEFANSIDECTDTTKIYVLPDNYFYAYMSKYVEGSVTPNFENQIGSAEDTDGNVYNSIGYKDGVRLNSSGADTPTSGYSSTGYIRCVVGDVIRMQGIHYNKNSSNYGSHRITFSKEDKSHIQLMQGNSTNGDPEIAANGVYDSTGDLVQFTVPATIVSTDMSDTAWFRVCGDTFDSEVIITVNEEIAYITIEEGMTYAWTNTGHAFVPADYEEEILALKAGTKVLERKLDELSVGDGGTFIYVEEEAARVAQIVKEHQTVGSLTFTAMSDCHIRFNGSAYENNITSCRDAGLGLAELRKLLKLDCAVMLGDYTAGGSTDTVALIKEDLTGVKDYMANGMIGIPNIWCTGNHDINYGANSDRRMTEDELFAYLTNNNTGTVQDSENVGRNYGYTDFENQKIRCIYLNTVDSLDYPDNTGTQDDASEITAIQTQWLVDEGLNFADKENPSEWGIIVFSHHCLSIFPHVVNVLKGYKDGTSGSCNVTTNGIKTTVSYDFESLAERAEVICSVHGHNHNFMDKKISDEGVYAQTDENTWLWSIAVPNMDTYRNNACASYDDPDYARVFGEYDIDGNAVYYDKTQETATSTSFSVVTIDRKNRKVYATAYGAGYDRVIDY